MAHLLLRVYKSPYRFQPRLTNTLLSFMDQSRYTIPWKSRKDSWMIAYKFDLNFQLINIRVKQPSKTFHQLILRHIILVTVAHLNDIILQEPYCTHIHQPFLTSHKLITCQLSIVFPPSLQRGIIMVCMLLVSSLFDLENTLHLL